MDRWYDKKTSHPKTQRAQRTSAEIAEKIHQLFVFFGRKALLCVLCKSSPRSLRFNALDCHCLFFIVVDDSLDTIFQHYDVKVNQQPHLQTQKTQVGEHLRIVNGMQLLLALEFHRDTALNYEISPESAVQLDRLVEKWNRLLRSTGRPISSSSRARQAS
jgi:hypothetical protein